jgi:hypothetical protein
LFQSPAFEPLPLGAGGLGVWPQFLSQIIGKTSDFTANSVKFYLEPMIETGKNIMRGQPDKMRW